jgi:diguanylate cyclase (GGDEF)-like protein/PAS domain S-box-containing protein
LRCSLPLSYAVLCAVIQIPHQSAASQAEMLFHLLPRLKIIKVFSGLKKQAIHAPRETGEELFLRQPGCPFYRIRGFAPPSSPRFIFSETHNCIEHHKERTFCYFKQDRKEADCQQKNGAARKVIRRQPVKSGVKKLLIFGRNRHRLSGMESGAFAGVRYAGGDGAMTDGELYKSILDNMYDGVYFVDCSRKITYWNKGAERISGYQSAEVLGKHCSDNILMHVDDKGASLCKGMCPLAKTISDRKIRETEAYLHHKKGHRVPVLIRTTPLYDGNDMVVGAVEIFSDNSSQVAVRQRAEELQKMALFDPLTGAANRRYIEMNLDTRLNELQRYGWPFGILFIDIDHFKGVNDRYGHQIGDRVLKMVAETIMSNLRPFDILGRWGGEEFLSVIVNVDKDLLYSIARRFCLLVEQSSLHLDPDTLRVTVSIGATLAHGGDTVEELVKRADGLMYLSKTSGRNQVSMGLNE